MSEGNVTQAIPPKTPQELLISGLKKRVQLEHDGIILEFDLRRPTRLDRNQALEIAAAEYTQRFPQQQGFLPTVFEREIAYRVITWSSLGLPKEFWPMLPTELGDKISKLIGVEEILGSLKGVDSPEVKKAKNSSSESIEVH